MTGRSDGRITERIRSSIRVAAFVSIGVFVSWVSPDTVAPRSSFWYEWPPLPRSIAGSDAEYRGPAALSEEGTCYWITDVSDSDGRMAGGDESVGDDSGGTCHHDGDSNANPVSW